MLLIAAVHVVNRRGRTEIRAIPIARLPLWQLVVDEAIDALRTSDTGSAKRSRRRRRGRSPTPVNEPGRTTHHT
jgi:hypothetical protein